MKIATGDRGVRWPSFTVTKIDAARRQLEVAALLYFNDRDPLAIYTLAAAAQGVLETLMKQADKTTPFHDSLAGNIPPNLDKEIRQAFRVPQNFLKHSGRDPDGTLEFCPAFTEIILYDSVAAYGRLTGELPALFGAFAMWFAINHPTWFTAAGPDFQKMLHLLAGEERASFLETYLAQRSRIRP